MDDAIDPILGRDESLARVLGLYDTPAYVRRGVQLAESRERVFRCCAVARDELLRWVRMRLRVLGRLVRDWSELATCVASPRDVQLLVELSASLEIGVDAARRGAAWARQVRSALRDLIDSINRFNDRWRRYIDQFDLTAVNREVAAYNRYYLLEKECALRSPRLAARGFRPAVELSRADLLDRLPLLDVPKLAGR